MHELIGRLSTKTVQAPQTSDSQERLVPVSLSRLRKNSSKVSSTGTSPDHLRPFTCSDRLKLALLGNLSSAISTPLDSAFECSSKQHADHIQLVFRTPQKIVHRPQEFSEIILLFRNDLFGVTQCRPSDFGLDFPQPLRSRPDTANGNTRLFNDLIVHFHGDGDAECRSLKAMKAQISALHSGRQRRNLNFRQQFVRSQVRRVHIQEKILQQKLPLACLTS